jgi:hypothetical protein
LPNPLGTDERTQQSVAVDIFMDDALHHSIGRRHRFSLLPLKAIGNLADKVVLQGIGYVGILPDIVQFGLGDLLVRYECVKVIGGLSEN